MSRQLQKKKPTPDQLLLSFSLTLALSPLIFSLSFSPSLNSLYLVSVHPHRREEKAPICVTTIDGCFALTQGDPSDHLHSSQKEQTHTHLTQLLNYMGNKE